MRAFLLLILCILINPFTQAAGTNPQLPSLSAVQEKLAALDTATEPELAKVYRDIINELEQMQLAQNQQAEYQATIDNFTKLSDEIANKSAKLQREQIKSAPKSDSELDRLVSQTDAELVQVQSELVDLDQEIANINQRVPQIPGEIERLKAAQRQLDLDKGSSAPPSNMMSEALQWLPLAKNARIEALLRELDLEQLSSNNRLDLSRLKRDLQKQRLAKLSQQLKAWRSVFTERLRAGTAQLVEAAKLGAEEQFAQDPLLSTQAKENEEWAGHLSNLTELIEQTAKKRTQTASVARDLAQDRSVLQEQLGLSEVGEALGERLLNQFEVLGRIKPDAGLDDRIAKARLWRFRYREQAELMQDREALIRSILAENNILLNVAQREQLNKLLDTREQLINQLNTLQEKYILELAKYQGTEKQRLSNAAALRELISQHLLWVANTRAIDLHWPMDIINSTQRIFDKEIWLDIKLAAESSSVKFGVFLAACLLTLLLHNSKRRHLHNEISELAKPVGRVTQDDISFTLKALALSFLAAVIYLLPLLALAWLFRVPNWEHPHAAALGEAALSVSRVLLVLLFIHQLCRPKGVLCCHFARDPKITAETSKALSTFGLLYIPLGAISLFCNHFSDPLISAGIGRLLFVITCGLLTLTLLRITRTYLLHTHFIAGQKHWFTLFRWGLIMVPLVALGAALGGYYYSGRVLLGLVADSLILCGLFWLVYMLAHRFMAIQERRLAYERAKAKRAELIAQREKDKDKKPEDSIADSTIEVEEYEVDVDLLKAQALRLIRVCLLVGLAFALMGIWSDVLSALTWLDDIVVWQTQRGDIDIDITLKKMLASALTLGMTLLIAKNLPSLIELSILQRLTLEPGVGFAISTLTRYGATLIGTLWGFSIIGFEWSKLQWLVAALGVGLGFGLQEIFANMVSGLIILFERPIRPGDTVTIDNLSGTVSKIHIRATTIVDWDRKEIVIPNKTFITQQFVNWSLSDGITRIVIKVGVAYGSDVELVERLLREAIRDCPQVLEVPEPSVFFLGFGNSTLDFEVRVFTGELGQRLPVTHRMHQLINAKFNAHGITIAFPQLDVHMFRGK